MWSDAARQAAAAARQSRGGNQAWSPSKADMHAVDPNYGAPTTGARVGAAVRDMITASAALAQGHPKSAPAPVAYGNTGPRFNADARRAGVPGGAGRGKPFATSAGTGAALGLRRQMKLGRK